LACPAGGARRALAHRGCACLFDCDCRERLSWVNMASDYSRYLHPDTSARRSCGPPLWGGDSGLCLMVLGVLLASAAPSLASTVNPVGSLQPCCPPGSGCSTCSPRSAVWSPVRSWTSTRQGSACSLLTCGFHGRARCLSMQRFLLPRASMSCWWPRTWLAPLRPSSVWWRASWLLDCDLLARQPALAAEGLPKSSRGGPLALASMHGVAGRHSGVGGIDVHRYLLRASGARRIQGSSLGFIVGFFVTLTLYAGMRLVSRPRQGGGALQDGARVASSGESRQETRDY